MPKTLGPVRCLAGWLVVGWLAGVRLVGVWLAAIRQAEETGRLERVPSYRQWLLLGGRVVLAALRVCRRRAVCLACLASIIHRQRQNNIVI